MNRRRLRRRVRKQEPEVTNGRTPAGEGAGNGGLGGSRLHQAPPAGANSKEGPAGSSANPAAPMTSSESKSAATSSAGAQQPREQRNRFDKGASGGRKPQSANEAKAHEETVNGTAA